MELNDCDRCGARGKMRAVLPNGLDLVFCGHHAREYETQLVLSNAEIIREDETAALQPA